VHASRRRQMDADCRPTASTRDLELEYFYNGKLCELVIKCGMKFE